MAGRRASPMAIPPSPTSGGGELRLNPYFRLLDVVIAGRLSGQSAPANEPNQLRTAFGSPPASARPLRRRFPNRSQCLPMNRRRRVRASLMFSMFVA